MGYVVVVSSSAGNHEGESVLFRHMNPQGEVLQMICKHRFLPIKADLGLEC